MSAWTGFVLLKKGSNIGLLFGRKWDVAFRKRQDLPWLDGVLAPAERAFYIQEWSYKTLFIFDVRKDVGTMSTLLYWDIEGYSRVMRLLLAHFRVLCLCYSKERSKFMFTSATSSSEGLCYGNIEAFIDESQLDIFSLSCLLLKLLLSLFTFHFVSGLC